MKGLLSQNASFLRSNRTFMELKWVIRCLIHMRERSSNRTFMELKFKDSTQTIVNGQKVLIVPLWN